MFESYIIKSWSEEDNCWYPVHIYPFKKPRLPRTIGYMCQADIEKLKTKNDILKMLRSMGKITRL